MRKLTATLCLTLTILLGSVGMSASADLLKDLIAFKEGTIKDLTAYKKGLIAYQSGDYATALREWTPLAEQGDARAQFQIG